MTRVSFNRVCATSAIAIAGLLLLASGAHAQTTSGSFTGTVVDDSGSVLPGATVTITEQETGAFRVQPTSGIGGFTFAAVLPGIYTVRIELQGFSTYELIDANLATNQVLSLGEVQLGLAALAETVQVTATEQRVVETITSDRSALITEDQIETITVRGRDVTSMLRILPGVAYEKDPDAIGSEIVIGSWLPEVQGARAGWATVTIDGIPSNDIGLPSVSTHSMSADAVGEVNVQLSNFTADSGRNGGANINIVTKSGSNLFSGGLYAYGRNEKFRGQNFFDEQAGLAPPKYRYSTLGGNLGGPIVQDKVFFFYNYENWSATTPRDSNQATLPSDLERLGDFSNSRNLGGDLHVITDPTTGMPFPGNIIPGNRIDSNGQALLSTWPRQNVASGGNFNYQFLGEQTSPRLNHVVRMDLRPTQNDSFYGRFSKWHQPTKSTRGGLGVTHEFTYDDYATVGNYTRVIGDSMVNEFTFGYRHSREWNPPADSFDIERITRGAGNSGFTLGQFNSDINPFNLVPEMNFGSLLPDVANLSYDSRFVNFGNDDLFTVNNALSMAVGQHNLRMGFYYEHLVNIEGRGASSFAGTYDFGVDTNNPLDTNHPYGNAMLGNFLSYTENSARLGQRAAQYIFNAFLQDKWQPTNKLTLDVGVRLGTYTQYKATPGILGDGAQATGEAASFVASRFNPANVPTLFRPVLVNGERVSQNPLTGEIGPAVLIGAIIEGSGDIANGMVLHNDPNFPDVFQDPIGLLVEPRLGIAYDLRGDGRTAIRANFGIFHNASQAGALSWRQTLNPPFVFTPSVFYSTMDNLLGARGSQTLFPTGTVYGTVRENKPPRMVQFQAGIQHEVGARTVIDIAYVGTRGRNLPQLRNINNVAPGARFLPENQDPSNPGNALPDNFFRPFVGHGNILQVLNVGPSDYNALQVQANRRYTGGLEFTVAYTLAVANDYTSADILYGNRSYIPFYQDPDVYSYGNADFDRTHNMVISYNWDVPDLPADAAPVLKAIFNNWRIGGMSTFTTGVAVGAGFTTTDGADILGGGDDFRIMTRIDGLGAVALSDRPNINGDTKGAGTIENWFDGSVFSRPAQGEVGSARKDDIRLPGLVDFSLRLAKRMTMNTGGSIEVGVEMYNLFNQVQYLNVDTTAEFDAAGTQTDPRFGQVISSRTPFTALFSLRYRY
jgi:hypothetical protein